VESSEFRLHAELEDSHWWFCARREIIFSILSRYVPPDQGRLVAEIGCGTGGNLRFLQSHYRVVGSDISPVAVSYAREMSSCPIVEGDYLEAFSGIWGDIDAVLLADVLEHVADDARFLAQLVGCMKVGSVMLLTVPAYQWLWSGHDSVLGHKRRYSAATLRSSWKGLAVEEQFLSPINCVFLPLIAIVRLLKRRSATKSSLSKLPFLINKVCHGIFSVECRWLRHMPLPWGASLLAVVRKKG